MDPLTVTVGGFLLWDRQCCSRKSILCSCGTVTSKAARKQLSEYPNIKMLAWQAIASGGSCLLQEEREKAFASVILLFVAL